ncbi:23S rRNA (adenine(2503)-C(2))-methyltransferase RlmN [Candidatus Electronema sp. JM]|uniref:23S rRNA (adenine(2503)-C(2))-methyltransferase RlmN n=1 Tax=Candidatus Electronema sp. JM TaxID=3401571 RepID=UPI003AA84F8E
MRKTDLKNFTQDELVAYAVSLGQPAFRGRQLLPWLYKPGITEFSQMTDLAKEFRAALAEQACMSRFGEPVVERSADGAVKFGFRLEDGLMIESVLIPEEDRNTLCVSSQAGCAMKCRFCMTGQNGFRRNLSRAEIVNQICAARDWLLVNAGEDAGLKLGLTNLVFMGMGEPLANFDNLLAALSILTEQRGLDFSARRITVSTCGLVPQMLELGRQASVNLAVSLHAADNETRSSLMPVNDRWPIEELLTACKNYSGKKRQRIMFEYTLFEGINDSDADARKLAALLREVPCKINLLAMNECPGLPYHSPPFERLLRFQKILMDAYYTVFIRKSRGADISAACGLLADRTA